jgi:LysM repeat protein
MWRFAILCLVVVSLAAVACGGGGGGSPTATPKGAPNSTTTQQVAGARTETPIATATPVPTVRPATYTVVEGDTLSAIAERFSTTIEALVAANALADPDTLDIGQQLKIPPAN